MPLISPAERPFMDLVVPFHVLKDLRHSYTPSTRFCREGSPFPIDMMLSDEAGRLPEQPFLKGRAASRASSGLPLFTENPRRGILGSWFPALPFLGNPVSGIP